MKSAVSAADANRKFSEILRNVREGHHYVVTSHGRPVARIVPFKSTSGIDESAHGALLARLKSTPVQDVGRWSRDDLYDDGL
jgi:prevent-host-death family protein